MVLGIPVEGPAQRFGIETRFTSTPRTNASNVEGPAQRFGIETRFGGRLELATVAWKDRLNGLELRQWGLVMWKDRLNGLELRRTIDGPIQDSASVEGPAQRFGIETIEGCTPLHPWKDRLNGLELRRTLRYWLGTCEKQWKDRLNGLELRLKLSRQKRVAKLVEGPAQRFGIETKRLRGVHPSMDCGRTGSTVWN